MATTDTRAEDLRARFRARLAEARTEVEPIPNEENYFLEHGHDPSRRCPVCRGPLKPDWDICSNICYLSSHRTSG